MQEENVSSSWIERAFEWSLWQSRLITLIIVICSMISSGYLLLMASAEVYHTIIQSSPLKVTPEHTTYVLANLIGAVDLYLIGVMVMLFGFGIYELFISQIEIGQRYGSSRLLDINNLDDLKNKLLKVVVMALVIWFFRQLVLLEVSSPIDVLYFSLAILAVAISVMLIRRRDG